MDSSTNKLPESAKIGTSTNEPTQYYPVRNFP